MLTRVHFKWNQEFISNLIKLDSNSLMHLNSKNRKIKDIGREYLDSMKNMSQLVSNYLKLYVGIGWPVFWIISSFTFLIFIVLKRINFYFGPQYC